MRIWASLQLLSADEGGRTQPFISGYRPQFFTDDPNVSTSAFVQIEDGRSALAPGERGVVAFDLLLPDLFDDQLTRGTTFSFREGPKTVATGTIERIDS